MNLDNVVIEITRRCNMQCAHCLRGEPECKSISDKVLNQFFFNIRGSSIGILTITGGEPSIAPSRIQSIVHHSLLYRVDIGSFYMVTNAKRITRQFLDAVQRLYDICDDKGSCGLNYSNDKFHEKGAVWGDLDKLEMYCGEYFVGGKDHKDYPLDYNRLLTEGRSESMGCRDLTMSRYEIEEGDVREGLFYLNALGKILPSCDMSYNTQREECMILGDVFDSEFNLVRYAEEYNLKLEQLRRIYGDGEICFSLLRGPNEELQAALA